MESETKSQMPEIGKNKYSKSFKVPDNFDEVLRRLTREILRNQPEDINKFGENAAILCSYFRNIPFL